MNTNTTPPPHPAMGSTIHLELKKARAELGLSQFDLAEIMGVSLRTLQSWEQRMRFPSGSARKYIELKLSEVKLSHKKSEKKLKKDIDTYTTQ